jgi:O-antigen/teichoic acid export membrane protein
LKTPGQHVSNGLTLRANFSWTFVGNIINAASWFTMTIVLARLGTPEDVGKFALGLATTAPIFMFATLRLRDVQATDARQEFLFEDYFALRLTTTIVALVIIGAIVIISGFALEMSLIILATGVSKAIEAISDAFYGLFMQRERLDRIAKSLMIKGPLSLLGLSIGFFLTGSVFWAVVGLVIARAFIMVSFDIRNVRLSLNQPAKQVGKVLAKNFPRPRFDTKTLTKLFWLALPLGFVTMLISFNLNIPRYFIEGYIGTYQLGIFAAIAAFQKAAPTVVQALGRSAAPRLAKYYAAKNFFAYRKLASKLTGIGVLLGSLGVLVAFVAGRQILTIFYGPEYAMPELFTLLMIAAGFDYIATMLLFVITSARYFRIQLPLHILTTSALAIACFILIPSYGLAGAATALIICYFIRMGSSLVAASYTIFELKKVSTNPETQLKPVT